MENCFCGSGLDHSSCCGPILEDVRQAATAEGLMRARFSAYATRNLDFIINSTLPASRSDSDLEAMRAWSEQAEWEGLEVVATRHGEATDVKGEVEFIAHYKLQGIPHHHHEKSRFVKQDSLWFFEDGSVVYSGPSNKPKPVVNAAKAGRNDPCPCGSCQKFKKCCGV